ncbi:hypothetical protein SDRG_15159 [Saprolegnia diclina VS20]|uniref:Uncharacterized protein n=1 Tax=Saprolegnia diclina (strain VS20) TaxID=1156394 RepID=T0Q112_SAPDV|nr:hypothetical protein SDRG_15159 [Saprolegnia diclina VS20]EQC27045.1 hypothetical protein SDRG_15159 [Saprolegnia diclina VS20]|eukprot:XP_008619545.1 hypothetical protein SDRG_15159 [Saprolegnia diclina VS20]
MSDNLANASLPLPLVLLLDVASQLASAVALVLICIMAINAPIIAVLCFVGLSIASALCDPETTSLAVAALERLLHTQAPLLQLL